jgi:hypothetical protein
MMCDSVISRIRLPGLMPAARVLSRMCSGRPGASSSAADRFDAGDEVGLVEAAAQLRRVLAGARQQAAAHRHDHAAALGERDEDVGRDEAALAVDPARERFDTARAAAGHVDDRLVVELELVAQDRVLEVALEREAVDGASSIEGSNER